MASQIQQTTIDDLPDDVLSNIFIRLLARELVQMKCVSKSWNDLLSQSSFVKSHLQRSIRNNVGILLFFHYEFSFRDGQPLAARPSQSHPLELTDFIKLPVNLETGDTYGNVVGSVNGLICFTYGTIHDSTFYIWNPSLSVVLTIPPSSFPTHDYDVTGIPPRFGYDPKTDDYKLVKVTRYPQPKSSFTSSKSFSININPDTVYKVEVYSMRTGIWQLISERFPAHITMSMFMHGTEFCVDGRDGHIHWFGLAKSRLKTIVAFDLSEETFRVMYLPDFLKDTYMEQFLGVLGGKLCVMLCVLNGGCEVWVMEEYGVAESWVKHHVFPQVDGGIVPYGFTFQNEFLFEDANYHDEDGEDDHSFSLYDPIAAETKCFEIQPGTLKVVEYVDSLVWVAPEVNCCSFSQLKI